MWPQHEIEEAQRHHHQYSNIGTCSYLKLSMLINDFLFSYLTRQRTQNLRRFFVFCVSRHLLAGSTKKRSTKKQIKRIKQTKQIISENLKSAKPKYFVDLLFRLSKKQIKLDRLICVSSKKQIK